MSQTRRCGGCGQAIVQKRNLEVTLCVYETDDTEIQDEIQQAYDDYCDGCVLSGVLHLLQKIADRRRARKAKR